MEQSTYVRRGFDYAELQEISNHPNPIIEGKEWVLFGEGARIIRNAPLPDKRISFSLISRRSKAEEFTIIIPVEFDSRALVYLNEGAKSDILYTAGVYFSGIGENWEIYFNGNLIRSEMHLSISNGKENDVGRIVSQRFWRDLFLPIDKDEIVFGTNILAVRIIGDPVFESTGLRSRVHYIDDYRYIAAQQRNIYYPVLCAIFVFTAYTFLLIYFYIRSRQELYYLWFSIFSFFLCIYTVMRHGTINTLIPNSYITRLLEYLSLMLLIIAYAIFVEISLRGKLTIFLKGYVFFCTLLAIFQIFILKSWGEEAIMVFDLSILVYIIYVVFYDMFYTFVFEKKRYVNNCSNGNENLRITTAYGHADISAFYIISGTLIVSFCGIFEIVGFVFLFDLLPFKISTLFINSTIAVQIGMTFMLSQRFSVLYKQLKQSNITLENTVRERTRELEEQTLIAISANRAKSEFLANISHDLKTPLAVMSLNLETLSSLAETKSDTKYQRHVRTAYQKNLDLQRLTQNLFEASRLESGSNIYTVKSESMLRLLAVAREKYDLYLEDQGLTFDIVAEDDIEILTDTAKIWSVFDNIIYNAVRYTKSGGITISASGVTVTITDTGCGIEPEHLPHVFEQFYKASHARNTNKGESGLGLYLVKSIMEGCGGSAAIESGPGKGTSVILTFVAGKSN